MKNNMVKLDDIIIKRMSKPHYSKFKHYEDYYLRTGALCHDIYINEKNEIIDGYCSYLISKKYKYTDYIVRKTSSKKVYKVVNCWFYNFINDKVKVSNKIYSFRYNLKYAVSPGDIVLIEAHGHLAPLIVESIEHIELADRTKISKCIYKTTRQVFINGIIVDRQMIEPDKF
ncbi:MAG: hypothetical protein K6E27_08860 [Eubacterium sp.]|nr:hypothetical protein [Eubacterium sp.]